MPTLFVAGGLSVHVALVANAETMDLSGSWGFRIDRVDQGIKEAWYEEAFEQSLNLPGCMQEQGHGDVPGPETIWWGRSEPWLDASPWMAPYQTAENFKSQFFLIPDRHYIGPAWYAKTIEIPESWSGKRVQLHLERCHWESRLWVDGHFVGVDDSLATPHEYDLGVLEPGTRRIVLRIDNSEIINLGEKAHSVSEQTAGTWNGIVGAIQLQAFDSVSIDSFTVSPKPVDGKVRIRATLTHPANIGQGWTLTVDASGHSEQNHHDPLAQTFSGDFASGSTTTEVQLWYSMGEGALLWDEFDPHLYRLEVALSAGALSDSRSLIFGLRDISHDGEYFTVNGTKTFIRGNTDCAVMPATGYAPMDVESWRKIWQTYKDFGLNMARFHSWCPPDAAFVAANEIGIYLAPESGEWAWLTEEAQFDFLRRESRRIIETYGHHPSFVMKGLGNERGGDYDFLTGIIDYWKSIDDARLFTGKANAGESPKNIDYRVWRGSGFRSVFPLRYQLGWPPRVEGSTFNIRPPQTVIDWREATEWVDVPVIQHESAQICAYPDIEAELPKYTGYLNATYLEIARDQLQERGMWEQLPDFVEASGKWQVELTREEFEAALRTPGLAGYHWLGLNDFTGQTTAPVGFTDAFYDTKPYVDPAYVRQWNAPTVLLARLQKRVFLSTEHFEAALEVTHFGKDELVIEDAVATLRTEAGELLREWSLPDGHFTQGAAQPLGRIDAPFDGLKGPIKLMLSVESKAHALVNEWPVWVYPDERVVPFPETIHVAYKWDAATLDALENGATVLLQPPVGSLSGNLPSCFTNHYWTSIGPAGGQSSASGVLIDPEHPVFAQFPTDPHLNWNWWDVLRFSQPMILDSYDSKHSWPIDHRPLLQPIDSWKTNRKLALLTEAKFGSGKLLICSINLTSYMYERPVARQLLKSILQYMQSADFDPKTEISSAALAEIFLDSPLKEATPNYEEANLPDDG